MLSMQLSIVFSWIMVFVVVYGRGCLLRSFKMIDSESLRLLDLSELAKSRDVGRVSPSLGSSRLRNIW